MAELTEKQQYIYEALKKLNEQGIEPTVRSLTDRIEERFYGDERWTDDEVRGLLVRIAEKGKAEQYDEPDDPDDPHRWRAL